MTPDEIGKTIRNARKALGLKQNQLASVAGIGVRTLSEIENGKQTAQIGLVLKTLGVLGIEIKLISHTESTVADDLSENR